MGENVEMNRKH